MLLAVGQLAAAQGFLKLEKDSIPLFRGFAISFDLVGVAQMLLSDHGQYEAAVRLNLHDQYFPVAELGYGRASHKDDIVTGITYETKAPYFRVGIDVNVMKRKHTGNRVYVGARYGRTSYKVDISNRPVPDPVWQWDTSFGVRQEQCSLNWAEALFGIEAKVFGPLHLGWTGRYRFRLSHNEGRIGRTWYAPGFGINDSSALGTTFNVTIDI